MRIALLLRRSALAGLALVLGLGVGLAALTSFLSTETGQRQAAQWLASALSDGARRVEISRLQIGLPGEIRLSGITAADATGAWLAVDEVGASWRPAELLRGRLVLARLEAATIDWRRLPEAADEAAAGEAELPSLPLAVKVEHLTIASLRLGPAVLGAEAVLRLEGELGAEGTDEIRSRLRIVRTDGGPAAATLEVLFRPRARWLSLAVGAEEPAGGLLPNLVAVPDQAFSLNLAGTGPLSSWQGKLAARIGGQPFLDLDIAVSEARELGIGITGRIDLSRHLPELASRHLDFEATLASRDRSRWRIDASQWRLDWVDLAVSGAVDLAGTPRVALELSARRRGEAPLPYLPPALSLGAISVTGRVEGPLAAPTLAMELQAEAAELTPLAGRNLALSLRFRPEAPIFGGVVKSGIELSGSAEALRAADERLAPLLDGAANLDLSLRLDSERGTVEADRFHLALAGVAIEGTLAHRLDTQVGSFAGGVTLPELSGLAKGLAVELSGEARLASKLRWDLSDPSLSGSVEGRAEKLRLADERLEALFGPALTLAADWQVDRDGRISVGPAAIEGRRFHLTGEAALAPGAERFDARLRLGVPDLAPLAPLVGVEAAGKATVLARLSGVPAAPAGTIELTVAEAAANGVALGTIAGRAELIPAAGGIRGTLELSATPLSAPLRLATEFRRQAGRTSLENIQVTGSGLALSGSVRLADDSPVVTGELAVEAGDLGPWLRLAGREGSGGLNSQIRLMARDGLQGVEAKATLKRFGLALDETQVLAGERLAVELTGFWPMDAGPSELHARGESLRLGEAVLKQATLRASGTPGALRFGVEAEGRFESEFTADVAGTLSRQGETVIIDLSGVNARVLQTTVTLSQPTRLQLAADGVTVERARFAVGEGTFELDGRLGQGEVDLRLRAAGLSLAPLAAAGADIVGRLDATVELRGDWPTPVGTAELSVAEVRWRGLDDLPAISGRLVADWRLGRIGLQGEVETGTGPPLRLSAALPLRVTTAPWAVLLPPQEPVSLEVSWQGEAAAVWRLLPYAVHRLDGALAVDLRLAGSVDRPVVNGSLTLSRGEYEHLELGTLLRDVELRLVTDGSGTLRIAQLSASDGAGGRLTGEGEISFRDLARVTYVSRVSLENFYVVRRDDLSGRVDGAIEISGGLDGGSITGQLTTRIVEVTLIDTLAAEVVELDVVEVGANRAAAGDEKKGGRRLNLTLDIQIDIPHRAYLRSRGLDSEWAGRISVSGTTTAAQVTGTLRAVRGRFTMLGKTFVLGTSTVEITTVDGKTDAFLDIAATHGNGDLEVTITVSGTATRPSFAWNSRPALPRDEIIARLLFGRGTGQLSAFEALQLAGALARLSGRGPSAGSIFERARRALGVDTLRLSGDAAAAGGATLEAGKYLSDKVYVGVQQGAAAGSSGARIELQVLPRVSIESEVQATGANIGAKFKWDY